MTSRIKTAGIIAAAMTVGIAACAQQGGKSTTTSTSKPQPTASTPSKANATAILAAHNSYRARHAARSLSWSDSLAGNAQAWADKCVFEHSGTSGMGENLLSWTGNRSDQDTVGLWYAENTSYDYVSGGPKTSGAVTGHFTQIVWEDTTEVGCGVAQCPSIGSYLVCNYAPAGNVRGRYTDNVSAPN